MKIGDLYAGGVPPLLSAINHKREKVQKFVDSLFSHEKHYDQEILIMMTASILRFYEELLDVIKNEPLGEFSAYKTHPAISTSLKNAGDVGLAEEDITTCSREIRHDFISKNWLAMPMSVIGETIGPELQESPMANMFVDARPVLTTMQDMSNALAVNNTMRMRLKEQVKELERKVEEQGKCWRQS